MPWLFPITRSTKEKVRRAIWGMVRPLGFRQKRLWALWVLAAYVATLLVLLQFHEIWRDEGRAYSLATEASSLPDLFSRLHNEGHPPLWYLMLYGAKKITYGPWVLRFCAITTSVLAAWVLLIRAPFPAWQRVLFIFGFFPVYEYSVVARNYGIGMLLLFVCAALYKKRFEQPLLVCFVVFLLSQTNAYGVVMAGAIGCALALQYLSRKGRWVGANRAWEIRGSMVLGLCLIFGGCLLAKIISTPDEFIKGAGAPESFVNLLTDNWSKAIREPATYFGEGFGLRDTASEAAQNLGRYGLLVAAICLLARPDALLIFAIGYAGMGLIATGVYHAFPRHQGNAYVLLVAAFWIAHRRFRRQNFGPTWLRVLRTSHRVTSSAFLTILLWLQLAAAKQRIEFDYAYEISSVKRMGVYLNEHSEFRNAIVIGEPDMFMEALPCYVTNRIYNVREARFKGYGDFDRRKNREWLSIHELLAAASGVRAQSRQPVLVALRYKLQPDGPYAIRTDTGWLLYSQEEYAEFSSKTALLAEFRGSRENDEDFDLYILK